MSISKYVVSCTTDAYSRSAKAVKLDVGGSSTMTQTTSKGASLLSCWRCVSSDRCGATTELVLIHGGGSPQSYQLPISQTPDRDLMRLHSSQLDLLRQNDARDVVSIMRYAEM